MKKNYKLGKLGLIAAVFLLISYLCRLTIYPCKKAAVILNPVYEWGFCPVKVLEPILGVHRLYFGFEAGKFIALVLNWFIAWGIVLLVLYLFKKYKK